MKICNLQPYDNPQRLVFYSKEAILFLLRGWDLASMVQNSRLDVALCGADTILELGLNVGISERFEDMKSPIGLCKRKDLVLKKNHLTVATEYPNLTRRSLNGRFDRLEVIHVHGATEALPHLNNVDAIVDIVETGQTLESNNLELIEILTYTYPCIVQNVRGNCQISRLRLQDLTTHIANAFANNSLR
jgi:ATP phosphoribosyltransferase